MNAFTLLMHEQIERLGRMLHFEARREVSDSVLALRLDQAYTPRVDLLWSIRLSSAQAQAIGSVAGYDPTHLQHLPIVGIEVEGTTPTTKTMAADVANIAAYSFFYATLDTLSCAVTHGCFFGGPDAASSTSPKCRTGPLCGALSARGSRPAPPH